MKESNFLYQCLDACLRLYKLLFSRHTKYSLPLIVNLSGCSIYISSTKSPWREAIFTLSCSIFRFILAAKPNTTRIEDILTTSEKISSKSMPFFRLKPFTTNLALYLGYDLFGSGFLFSTHLFFNALLPLGNSINSLSVVLMQGFHFFMHSSQPLFFSSCSKTSW